MINTLKIWIGIMVFGVGIIIFHSQELMADLEEEIVLEEIKGKNKDEFSLPMKCMFDEKNRKEVKSCNHFYCKSRHQLQMENLKNSRP